MVPSTVIDIVAWYHQLSRVNHHTIYKAIMTPPEIMHNFSSNNTKIQ